MFNPRPLTCDFGLGLAFPTKLSPSSCCYHTLILEYKFIMIGFHQSQTSHLTSL